MSTTALPHERTQVSWGLGLFAFALLGVLAPVLFVDRTIAFGSYNLVLSLAITEISAVKLSVLLARGEPRILAICFHLFLYPFMGLAALAQTTAGQFPLTDRTYLPGQVTTALLLVLFGLVAYEVGDFLGYFRKRAQVVAEPVTEGKPPSTRRFSVPRCLVLLAIGGYGILKFGAANGFSTYFSSRDTFAQTLAGPGATIQVYDLQDKTQFLLQNIQLHQPAFIALVGIISMRHRINRTPWLILLVPALALNVLANNPISNSRYAFGLVVIGVTCSILDWQSARGSRIFIASGLGVFIFAFGLLDAFRRVQRDYTLTSPRQSYLTDESYSAFQTVLSGLDYVTANGTEHGQQLLSSLLTFVPHSIWHGKRGDTGSLIDPVYNRAASLWTEFQVDFGVLGMVIGLFLFGFAAARLERRLTGRRAGDLGLLLPLLGGSEIFILRGSLAPALGLVYPLLAIFVFAASAKRPTGEAEVADVAPPSSVRRPMPARGRPTPAYRRP